MESISTCCFPTVSFSDTPTLQYSSTPILRLNGVGDADERVDVTEKHPLAASERIP
jgi:hypothetical protein